MPAKKPTPPAPRQARRHPTLKAWLANDANRDAIVRILEDPVFIAACHYICDSENVTPLDVNATSESIVRKAFVAAGLRAFPDKMRLLAATKTARSEPMPYEHIHLDNQ